MWSRCSIDQNRFYERYKTFLPNIIFARNSYRWYGKAFVGFLPIEFFREKLQKQFSFKVTTSLYRIKSILRLGCCCRQCCCHCHLRLTADGDVYFFDTHYWLIQMMMDRKFETYKIDSSRWSNHVKLDKIF